MNYKIAGLALAIGTSLLAINDNKLPSENAQFYPFDFNQIHKQLENDVDYKLGAKLSDTLRNTAVQLIRNKNDKQAINELKMQLTEIDNSKELAALYDLTNNNSKKFLKQAVHFLLGFISNVDEENITKFLDKQKLTEAQRKLFVKCSQNQMNDLFSSQKELDPSNFKKLPTVLKFMMETEKLEDEIANYLLQLIMSRPK